MWAIARYDLGLTDEEFGELTYGLFEALVRRKESEEKKQYVHTGILASSIINFSMCKPEEPVKVEDFIPGEKKAAVDMQKMSPEAAAQYIKKQFGKKKFSRT